MKTFISLSKLLTLSLLMLFTSCKKDKSSIDVNIMQHYIAGKFSFQQTTPLPFAMIPISANKAIFVWVSEKKEVDYTFENNKFKTKINGSEFSCDLKNGTMENIAINSNTLSIPIAALNKKEDTGLALAGKRFEASLNRLDNAAVLFDNYYFRFNPDATQFNYTSNPTTGNYLITTKTYEKLADGCFYDPQAIAFGVMLNNKLEVEAKIGNNYTLFSGSQK